ncbi:uncharacterized protein CMC5_067060 [Chondromyces crocatus]|uniref:HTH araC/xylS-type domain-containing protein n=1 Tax=Chondromyces crocatus TaxID=52 RepID=A0A0K1ENG6_CHOCO|nr:uncharacterized protein CMC5_067060 [Chondromyces crocatus]
MSPKAFIRSVRLQRAVRALRAGELLTKVAADAGYYDQSHMNADFRELLGMTPGAFMRRDEASPPLRVC